MVIIKPKNGLHIRLVAFVGLFSSTLIAAEKPNIVFVLCDDLGYGDIHCLNPERGKIPTPSADRLAKDGMIFTDAHSGSSVCTPTRYGLLTGRYSWRSRLQKGVVTGNAPCLIPKERPTVPSFLKSQGYHTAIIGKWHLDFLYQNPDGSKVVIDKKNKLPPVASKIPDGPVDRGFDYYHGFHHARQMKAVIEDREVILHEDEINMLPRLTRKAVEYIDERGATGIDAPFFLYVPFGSPHTPILPSKEWQGKSGLGDYADFVMQTDAGLGAILDALDRNALKENTIVIFSSDNGCSRRANFPKLEKEGHYPSANFRGAKADIWDGGHRIPFIVRWPGKVKAGTSNDQTLCLVDLFATCAELTGTKLPVGSAEDSVSFLPALYGKTIDSSRAGVIHHSISGHFAYRMGKWKLCLAKGSGGWTSPKENQVPEGSPVAQLYDLEADPGETKNLFDSRPEIAQRLLKQLEEDVERGRSVDGPDATNDFEPIKLWKSGKI